MSKMLALVLLMLALPARADDMQIVIDQQQIDKLDVKLGVPDISKSIPQFYAPGKVVVPANHELLVSSTQPGLVVQLLANMGDNVSKDQVLAKINSPELVGLQREFLTTASELALSDLEYKRDKNLLDEGVIAERRWQETQAVHSNKSAQFNTAKQLLLMAGMSVAEIKNLADSHQLNSVLNVRAPMSGIVLERMVTVGERLNIQAPLYRIADLSELWLEINIPQERLDALHIGDRVTVENTAVTAKISLLGQSVNHENQTILARAVLDSQSSSSLRTGQHVNVQISQGGLAEGFRVVNTAIAQNNGKNYIFVRNQQGFAVTEIKILGKQDAEAIISAPLLANERIAMKGAVALKAIWLHLGEE